MKSAFSIHVNTVLPTCSRCGEQKTKREMSKARGHLCKRCSVIATKAWATAHPKEWERHQRRYWLRDKYGMTLEQYDALLTSQGGVCAICGNRNIDGRGFRPHVDHDHQTTKVRGILCGRCNMGLGNFSDNIVIMKAAVAYLEKSR